MKTRILTALVIIGLMTACEEQKTSDSILQQKTEKLMEEAVAQTGMPAMVNWQEKKLMKQIYELRDQENLICHAYLFNKMNGEIGQYLGKCIGYGLPYCTQYSNPEKRVSGHGISKEYDYNIPQPEPNGLFMPQSLSATWLLLIDPKTNEARPVYIEPEIIVSPFKLHSK